MADTSDSFVGMSDSGKHNTSPKNKKKLFIPLFTSVILLAAVIGIVAGVKSRNRDSDPANFRATAAHTVLKSSCSSTFYPDLCYSAIATLPGLMSKKVRSQKDVIKLSLNLTTEAVEHNFFTVEKLIGRKNLTKREKIALHDCLETIDETLDELHKAFEDLNDYPGNNKSLSEYAGDLKTLMSAAMTNQETCLDGFSHDDADKHVREVLLKGQVHVEKMCSNALAMIKNMTDSDMKNEAKMIMGRKLKEEKRGKGGWPEWLSAGDRRLLQSSTVTPNVVVADDGSGDYRTVTEAVEAAPQKSSTRYVIRIKAGVYRENVEVPKKKTNIMFMGDGRSNTIITASRNVADGSTTFNSATVAVGQGFLARDITFQNTAGPSKHQAVALRVGADLSAFYQCDMLAYQDTLYVHSNRQFYINCLIVGTVDFIFGNAAAVLQDCDIHARRPNSNQRNMVTAQGRTDPNQNTGIVIQKSRIGATSDLLPVQTDFPTYLGRPWKEYSRTVIMQSTISDVIQPAGWFEWNGNFALDTLYYGEYQNSGPGAGTSGRVSWKGFKVITSPTEAQEFSPGVFIAGDTWLDSTSFPYSLGL